MHAVAATSTTLQRIALAAALLLGAGLLASWRAPAAEQAALIAAPAIDSPKDRGPCADRGALRRLLLGRAGRVRARARREPRGVGLRRRGEEHGRVRQCQHRQHRSCRIGADQLRSLRRFPTARSCGCSSRWRTIRRSSIARGRMWARSTARKFSTARPNRSASPRPTSRSWTRRMRSRGRSSRASTACPASIPAEEYHQDFLVHNPTYPYIVFNDLPKIENLKRVLPDYYVGRPVLLSNVIAH